ncbi:MAG: WG repeat-containing protein, partial [Ruminiclostridium sp.]
MTKGLLIIVVFAVLALVAVANFPKDAPVDDEKLAIAASMSEIDVYCKKMMYPQAEEAYSSLALKYFNDRSVVDGYIDFCLEYGYTNKALDMCNKLLATDSSDKAAAEKILNIYYETGSTDIYKFMNKYGELIGESEIYKSVKGEIFGKFRKSGSSSGNISDWSPSKYTYVYDNDGRMGVASATGVKVVSPVFDKIYSYSPKGYVAIMDHDQIVYADANGQRLLVPYDADANDLMYLDYAGPFNCGLANVEKDGVWGYANEALNFGYMKYEQTTPFSCGIAAVKENGKWSIIDDNFQPVGTGTYTDVFRDDYGYCCFDNMVFLNSGSGWRLYELITENNEKTVSYSLELRGEEAFEDVRAFGEYGAVKKNGKWGFIRKDGTWLLEPKYEEAYSFRCGLAPVMKEGKWGYIAEDGRTVIDFTYDGAISFNSAGCSAVKSGEEWSFILLDEY